MTWSPNRDALRGRVAVVAGATRGAQKSVSSAQIAREYGFTDLDGSRPDIWGRLSA